MEEIRYERGRQFQLKRPSIWRERFELMDGPQTIAVMFFPKWYSDRAEINFTGGKSFEIMAKNFFRLTLMIREKGYENPVAEYEASFFGKNNILTLPMGVKIRLVYKLMKDDCELQTENGTALFTVKRKSLLSQDYDVYIENNSEYLEKHPWMILFACYKLHQRKKRRH